MTDRDTFWQDALDGDHATGDVIPYPDETRYLVVGTGSNFSGKYLLSHVGVDRFGRLWMQDADGLTMIADFSANVPAKG